MRIHRVAPNLLDLLEATAIQGPKPEWLAEAVESLPEPYRTVIEAVYWEQVPRRVLAKRMGLPARSVVERLLREALDRLREAV